MRGGPQGGRRSGATPALFNREARLMRHEVNTKAYSASTANQSVDLPNVGYHCRVLSWGDLSVTMDAAIGGTWKNGLSFKAGQAANKGSFPPAPWGLINRYRYALNTSSPVVDSDGIGNWFWQLIQNRGASLMAYNAENNPGLFQKEYLLGALFNSTDGNAIEEAGQAPTASKTYKLRIPLVANLAFTPSAVAGLIPVQDTRIKPQIIFDFAAGTGSGNSAPLMDTADDATAAPSGNFRNFVDTFVTPNAGIQPDTSYVVQSTFEEQSITGTGEFSYQPQIGGVLLQVMAVLLNTDTQFAGLDVEKIESFRLRVQRGITFEEVHPVVKIADERSWYAKRIPDCLWVWDHVSSAFGDPGLAGFRDRVESGRYTYLEYLFNIASSATLSGAKARFYRREMVKIDRLIGGL